MSNFWGAYQKATAGQFSLSSELDLSEVLDGAAPQDQLDLSEVLDGADHLRGVGVLVVVPRNDLNLVGVVVDLSHHGLGGVEQRTVGDTDDIGGNDLILVVAEEAEA